MKILLVKVLLFEIKKGLFLPARRKMDMGIQSSYSPPIGLLYLGRSLEDEGHTVEVIDFYCEKRQRPCTAWTNSVPWDRGLSRKVPAVFRTISDQGRNRFGRSRHGPRDCDRWD